MIAGMEEEEWEEMGSADNAEDDGIVWVLSKEERLRARGLVLR
jgi:hypothetical protein